MRKCENGIAPDHHIEDIRIRQFHFIRWGTPFEFAFFFLLAVSVFSVPRCVIGLFYFWLEVLLLRVVFVDSSPLGHNGSGTR